MQSDSHLLPDTLPTALRGPVLLAVIVFEISLLEVFNVHLQRTITRKNAKAIIKNKIVLNFHQAIHTSPSIRCPLLELLAAT